MKREILYSLPLCVALSVIGCGGDGGDGSSVTSYSGSQVQAAITTDNSEQLRALPPRLQQKPLLQVQP